MKEVGGYFGLEELISNEYYKYFIPLNNGRNALLYILKAKKIKKLYIPYYLCDVIRDMLIINNYDFEYYSIDSEFMPIFNKNLGKDEYLYVVNYYGQLTNEKILALKKQFGQIIMDFTQAFFQKAVTGLDTIYTCRKFFGVPDGAYLYTDMILDEKLKIDISKDRMIHLLGRYEGLASDYYLYFCEADESFNSEPIRYMSKLTHNILGAIDYDRVRRARNENYAYLDSKLCKQNKLKLIVPDGAFSYPYYLENGIEIRKALLQKKIYIPILWPNIVNDNLEVSIEYKYAANILPLPCDQRYSLEDMEYLIEEVMKCIN
jgi:hypothetical protein